MPLQIINRRDYLHNWAAREAESPAKGNLRRGEIAIAIVTDDGTDTGNITEVIGRIGPSDTPTPFSDCPVVFRSPRGFKGASVRPVLVDDAPSTNAVLAYDNAAGKFVTVDEDPGTYEEVDGTEGGGGEGGGNELEEIAPTILTVQSSGLSTQAVVDTNPTYSLTINVIGRPDPILSIEIEETAWPDVQANAQNFTISTGQSFNSDAPPQGVTVSVADPSVPDLVALGVRTYTISGLVVNRSVPMSRVAINAKIGASNPSGSSPVSVFATSGQIEFIDDPAESAQPPAISSVRISEGGSPKSKIANLATGGTATLTASYVANDFTEGVDNGTVTYQWYEGNAALVGETNASITITNDGDRYNDTQLSVQVAISDLDGSDSRRGYIAIGDYDEGFTELTPSADSKLVYVATDGDDAAAAAAKGRGYYLSSDPEIGPDPMNPVGPIAAYATIHAARGAWGQSGTFGGTGFLDKPDWFLLKRGQTFDLNLVDDPISNNTRCDIPFYFMRGRSPAEPFVVAAWGDPTAARPVLSGKRIHSMKTNTVWQSIEFDRSINSKSYEWESIGDHCTYEDCFWSSGFGGTPNVSYWDNLTLRRCVIADSWSETGHNQGMFITSRNDLSPDQYPSIVIEECIFDRNGYKQNPNAPTTWTANVSASAVSLPLGEGVQPNRTYFDRNIYGARYGSLVARGNIISRGGGGSSFQARLGGVMERNLFIFNESALLMGSTEAYEEMWMDGLAVRNMVLHDDIFLPPGGFGQGINIYGHEATFVASDNVVAHFHRYTGGTAAYSIQGKGASNKARAAFMSQGIVTDNVADLRYGANPVRIDAYYDPAGEYGINALTVDGNQFRALSDYQTAPNSGTSHKVYRADLRDDPTGSISWGQVEGNLVSSYTSGDIVYDRDNVSKASRGYYTFAEWQAKGYDSASTFYTDQAAFETAAGWTDPDRDILSYMQSVDPTYVVNEDVHVDDGSSGTKQAVRQKVWEVLDGGSGDPTRVAWAKLSARRYHAFLTFIEKARNNRKGAWDSRWTADAVNNYIREGYGKAAVGGAYTAALADLGTYA